MRPTPPRLLSLLRRPLPLRHPRPHLHTRTLFGRPSSNALPRPPPAGITTIQSLVSTLTSHEGRPPPSETLVHAFRDVARFPGPLSDEHAYGLVRTYQHLQGALPADAIRGALRRSGGGSPHAERLAKLLFAGLEGEVTGEDVEVFVGALATAGCVGEAAEVVREAAEVVRRFSEGEGKGLLGSGGERRCWEVVMGGIERWGSEREALEMWSMVRDCVDKVTPAMMGPVVKFYCRRGELEKTKEWYEKMVDEEGLTPEIDTYAAILKLCSEKGEVDWARRLIHLILYPGPGKTVTREAWDVVLQWTEIVNKDRSPNVSNDISQLLTLMTQMGAKSGIFPTIETFNELMRFAISRGDYKSARKHHRLAIHRKMTPNRRTHELHIEYLLVSGIMSKIVDVGKVAYKELRAEELPPSYPAHAVQLMLQALCRDPNPNADHTELIKRIYVDLDEWGSPLEIETTASLLSRFLSQCDFSAVISLLSSPSCATYTTAVRRKLIHELGEHIGRPTTSVEAAWDTYQILYQVFPELSVSQRIDIMRLFFTLDRSDMAIMVFKHMRGTPGRHPGNRGYIVALNGVAYSRDIDALKVVHNALKLDQSVDLDTSLMNALMNAYTRCGVPWRAVRFWEDVKASTEGPDYQSISAVLEAFGNIDGGVQRAKILWGQLRSMGIKPAVENYRSYIEALGKGERFDEAFRVAREMELADGIKPDAKLIGTVYALTASLDIRDQVTNWAKDSYPAEWKEVERRVEQLPKDILKHEALEALGGSQLETLLVAGQPPVLALGSGSGSGSGSG